MNVKTQQHVRVRFAPSPTGNLHIGGLRSALFNWLFARHYNGVFLLRIEDTDYERSKPEYTASILDSLAWSGIEPDEPMVIQSSRIDEHRERAQWLVEQGKAYRCVCTSEELLARYAQGSGLTEHSKYDGYCRDRMYPVHVRHVIRLRLADTEEPFVFEDLIRGTVTIPRDQIDDFVIIRSDGSPMYNFVVVVDDAYMCITHIIRGEEHIINTPKQIALYQALGYTIPQFAHIPLVLGPSGQKLSKREAATAVPEYRDAGYLPDALVNYLARLGWSHGDQEIFSRAEMIAAFSLEAISKSGAIFDAEKLKWVNSVYLRQLSSDALYELLTPYGDFERVSACAIIALYKERVITLQELADSVKTVLQGPATYAQQDFDSLLQDGTVTLDALIHALPAVSEWKSDVIQAAVKVVAAQLGLKLSALAQPIRVALTGISSGPGAFALLAVLDKQEALRRLYALRSSIVRS
jgi:glutamyl-tRNA synthetase